MKRWNLVVVGLAVLLLGACAGEAAKCGDGKVQGSEECDDGNAVGGDGCSSTCKFEGFCGNGLCENEETHSCPQDCDVCGNGICNASESVSTCFPDCYCTNGSCDVGEDPTICPQDCQSIPECGDGICESAETTLSCLQDCYCTNGSCDNGETELTCPQDCTGAVCGNGACEAGEIPENCPQDCPLAPSCGDGTCNGTETSSTCPADCTVAPYCGDGICNGTETSSTCPADCDAPVTCGNGSIDSGEECDGTNLGGASCTSLGYSGGTLSCYGTCAFNETACTTAGTCSLWTQTGCGDGEKCTVDTSTANRCNTEGAGLDMAVCNADADCAAGLTCSGLQYNAFGVCRRYCAGLTSAYDQLHCTGSAGSACKYEIVGGDNLVVPNTFLCTAPCDPVSGTGCPSGLNCDIFGLDRTSDGVADLFITECYETANPATSCNGITCSAGYGCMDFDGYGGACYKWCSTANTSCPTSLSCYGFAGAMGYQVIIGSIEYGYCDY